jgi:hypothetical protein
MGAQGLTTPRFLRKTTLRSNEYNTDFVMLDREAVVAVSSPEADQVTPLMSKVYLRIRSAPTELWEADGVLRLTGEMREGKWVKAWDQLCQLLGVSSATANKALSWMHEQAIIGYYAGKNGVGIRIFINRAASSIGVRVGQAGKKILQFSPASNDERRASQNEAGFNDTYGVLDDSDSDISPPAPNSGAATKNGTVKNSPEPERPVFDASQLVEQLLAGFESILAGVIRREGQHGFERVRDWMDRFGIPKATRVALHEGYRVASRGGAKDEKQRRHDEWVNVGRAEEPGATGHRLSEIEVRMYAEMCAQLFTEKGVLPDAALADLSVEAGGAILPEDAPRVRAVIEQIMDGNYDEPSAIDALDERKRQEAKASRYEEYLAQAFENHMRELSAGDWEGMLAAEREVLIVENPASRIFQGETLRKILESRVLVKLRAALEVKSFDEFESEE